MTPCPSCRHHVRVAEERCAWWYARGAAPPAYTNVGVCILPEPPD